MKAVLIVASISLTLRFCDVVVGAPPVSPPEGAELIGEPVPEWEVSDWIGSPPLRLEGLRGKVLLVRWFMSTDCPYCTATAPALNELHGQFKDRGLVVIGMYHHKDPQPLRTERVKGWAKDFGFHFPVAVDRDWRTLNRWWLNGQRRNFTSVSFLIDKRGFIRRIHPGGTMALGSKEYIAMRTTIETLLKE
jgi:peroxiredoxin